MRDSSPPTGTGPRAGTSARSVGRWRFGVLTATAILVVWHMVAPTGPAGSGTYLAATVGGALVALVPGPRPRRTTPWSWVTWGITLSAVAEVVYWSYSALFHLPSPDVSWADPAWLASYVGVGIGAAKVFELRSSRRGYRDVDALIDMAGAAVVGLLVMWTVVIESTFADTSTPLQVRVLWSAYPVLDVALLTLAVGGAIGLRRRRPELVLLCIGVACWVGSDVGYALVGTGGLDAWMDAGWMVGAAMIGLAVREGRAVARREDRSAPDPVARRSAGRVRLAIGMLPLVTGSAVDIWAYGRGADPNPWPGALATAALAALAYARCIRLVATNEERARELDASEHYYRMLATNSSDAVAVVSRHGVLLGDAPTFTRLVSIDAAPCGLDLLGPTSPLDTGALTDLLAKASMAPGDVVEGEVPVRRADRTEQWLDVRATDMVHDDIVGGVVINLHDITDRKRSEAELRTQAFHDSLTGLANRALFRDRVEHALDARGRTAVDPSVIFIDLDGFKFVNDTLGHETGDELLKHVAGRLVGAVRAADTVARLGGDEFAVLLESAETVADAPAIATRILDLIREPIDINGRSLYVSCSVGLALADATSDPSTLLRHADMAMYEAKARGKARWAIYDPSMGDAARERLILEADLHGALAKGQFELEYQPIITIDTAALAGFEALLRWRHPTLGTVSPERFIPILEENGQIVEIGGWVLATACETLAAWLTHDRAVDLSALTMSVNVSSVQLTSPGFACMVQDALATSGIRPEQLVLEVTETALVEEAELATEILHRLHALGTRLAIDDFGTGYSSLGYLRQFPVDILKIDRSFIQAIDPNGPMPTIVKGVLDLSRTLGIETVAEGIEQTHQLDRLGDQHCEKGQGFLFAAPLGPDDALRFIEAHAPRHVSGSSTTRSV
jgi:diguanylate cyclase (GGDEF)-like protein/PAS domain S-box-containing protein